MSCNAGPDVNESGLIFYMDMANTNKSWVGPPTTNLIYTTPLTLSLYAYVTGPVSTTGVLDYTYTQRTVNRYTITTVIGAARAALVAGITVGASYSFTFFIKYNGTNISVPSLYVDASKGSPEANGSNTLTNTSITFTPMGNNWYKGTYLFTVGASPTNAMILAWGVNTGTDAAYLGNTFDCYNEQLEQLPYPTAFYPGAGPKTNSLIDLTNNYKLTINNLVYNADTTFSFAGSHNIDLNSTDIITGTNPFTIESWTNLTSGSYGAIFGNYGSGFTSNTLWWATAGLYINGSVYHTNYSVAMAGKHHSAVTRDSAGSVKLYRDGVLVGTGTLASSIPAQQNFRIGTDVNGFGEAMNGNIYSVKVYNKVLTDAEIAQNFNAHRGRFGI